MIRLLNQYWTDDNILVKEYTKDGENVSHTIKDHYSPEMREYIERSTTDDPIAHPFKNDNV